uniref:Uncharacterized protein n=1 Tax=Plectus sambesii TaxID=2011161 RepID=A0A914URN0_9BILA
MIHLTFGVQFIQSFRHGNERLFAATSKNTRRQADKRIGADRKAAIATARFRGRHRAAASSTAQLSPINGSKSMTTLSSIFNNTAPASQSPHLTKRISSIRTRPYRAICDQSAVCLLADDKARTTAAGSATDVRHISFAEVDPNGCGSRKRATRKYANRTAKQGTGAAIHRDATLNPPLHLLPNRNVQVSDDNRSGTDARPSRGMKKRHT